MFINLKPRLVELEIVELLEYAMFPDPERVEKTLNQYRNEPSHEIYGIEENGAVIGLAGFTLQEDGTLHLRHIAVHPEHRGQGYGRGLILELIELKQPKEIVAETDEETVDFYRNVRFDIVSLGELYPGVERFHCVYEVNPAE
ncbi:GNAT family N-acetyltransferase [Paenibacillus filicis]|uniref:GNAT family N-acetyltransferase n=1 Tax=Paenibacillus gyeongsangnamensis TaxID=3388067 RepID=A0ABT4Q769_9BACL|nr:GNAT family N-acetyltransferase [Paenibacillus filicis]MCZ8512709.1 GNAT family N-acetyltransferase [Paenibacillus filicis]